MSNSAIIEHLKELHLKHKELDTLIKERYNDRASDEELSRLKTKKLWLKDEIHLIETRLQGANDE